MADINIFDRTLKIISRDHADVFLKLAFPDKDIRLIGTQENPELSLPEERVDFIHTIEYNGIEYLLLGTKWRGEAAFHFEFQLKHEEDFPKRVFIYSAEFTNQFETPVISIALYLARRKSSLPDSYAVSLDDSVINRFTYPVLKIWDYEKEIRGGKFPELIPLLPMIVEEPTEDILEEERRLILLVKDAGIRGRLLATAVTIASRYFERDFLWKFFREEVEQMREVPFISDWIKEAEEEAARKALRQGHQEGWEEGMQQGYTKAYKESIISFLADKFEVVNGNILELLEKVNRIDSLRMLLNKAPKVETQEEFQKLVKIALGG